MDHFIRQGNIAAARAVLEGFPGACEPVVRISRVMPPPTAAAVEAMGAVDSEAHEEEEESKAADDAADGADGSAASTRAARSGTTVPRRQKTYNDRDGLGPASSSAPSSGSRARRGPVSIPIRSIVDEDAELEDAEDGLLGADDDGVAAASASAAMRSSPQIVPLAYLLEPIYQEADQIRRGYVAPALAQLQGHSSRASDSLSAAIITIMAAGAGIGQGVTSASTLALQLHLVHISELLQGRLWPTSDIKALQTAAAAAAATTANRLGASASSSYSSDPNSNISSSSSSSEAAASPVPLSHSEAVVAALAYARTYLHPFISNQASATLSVTASNGSSSTSGGNGSGGGGHGNDGPAASESNTNQHLELCGRAMLEILRAGARMGVLPSSSAVPSTGTGTSGSTGSGAAVITATSARVASAGAGSSSAAAVRSSSSSSAESAESSASPNIHHQAAVPFVPSSSGAVCGSGLFSAAAREQTVAAYVGYHCAQLGISTYSPLQRAIDAGMMALPSLKKFLALMRAAPSAVVLPATGLSASGSSSSSSSSGSGGGASAAHGGGDSSALGGGWAAIVGAIDPLAAAAPAAAGASTAGAGAASSSTVGGGGSGVCVRSSGGRGLAVGQEVPVDVSLPPSLRSHSVFVDPVLRQQCDPATNPPILLQCGHVISRETLDRLSSGRPRFKCPTCPNIQQASQVLPLVLE